MAIWGPIIGAAVGLYGANKSANAAKQAQSERNEAVDQQYEYDVQAWQMQKEAAIADREYAVQEIQERARQEGMLAAYKDAQQAESYNYNLQIRNLQQETNEKMYRKSEDIYFNQLGINALEEREAKLNEKRQLKEITTKSLYEQNDAYLEALQAEGTLRARGITGRTADKLTATAALQAAQKMTMLDLSLDNATVESQSTMRALGRERVVSDLNAYAARMLDPGVLPMPIQPLPTPQATFMYPRVYEDYDFGPEPIRGAMISPSAAAAQVWGTSISSLAGMTSQIITGLTPSLKA
tara:strand:- start:3821 stop:4708 length:888 start_codon:yes stop_codon:yes gene_type:complete